MGEKPAGPEASGGPLSSVVPSSGEEAALKEGAKRKTVEQLQEEARRILEEEEAAAAAVKQQKRKNKLQELQEIRSSLNRKQVEILQKQQELLEKDQTVAVLTQEVLPNLTPSVFVLGVLVPGTLIPFLVIWRVCWCCGNSSSWNATCVSC
jgi:multidrug efflux pump subunit AcrA (membrane-fusion protein)